jgi:hypothetical protein
MARYRFKPKDLAPFKAFLSHPSAIRLLTSAVPIKQLTRARPLVEDAGVVLSVPVQSLKVSEGVALEQVFAAVKAIAPDAKTLTLRGRKVDVTYGREPTAEVRESVRKLLGDERALTTAINKVRRPGTGVATPGVPIVSVPGGARRGKDLVDALTNDATPDAEWLRAFRKYATENLLRDPKEGEP